MPPAKSRKSAPRAVRVSVPATSANLGPGFDTLGIAVELTNEFTVTRLDADFDRIHGEGTCAGIVDGGGVLFEAMDRVCELANRKRPTVEVMIQGRVPMGRGLGSSATALVAGALAANALLGNKFTPEDLISPLTELEGHPDNVAPALFGALTASVMTGEGVLVHAYKPHADWRIAALIPSYQLPTSEARRAIPAEIPLKDAVFNLTRVSFVIDALVEGDADILSAVLSDRLHEPYRKKFIRDYDAIRDAALHAGAAAFYLSGAGPTLAAFCQGERAAERVRRAMSRAAVSDPAHEAVILMPRRKGAQVRALA